MQIHVNGKNPGALPIVPQVHCTFFNFPKDFKAALQLWSAAVGPQSPHVHHPSLLLLVKTERQSRRKEIKRWWWCWREGNCFFSISPSLSSPGLNELVLITPVDTATDYSPLFSFPLSAWLFASLSDGSSSLEAPSIYLDTTIPLFSPQLINPRQNDFYQMMLRLKFWAWFLFWLV